MSSDQPMMNPYGNAQQIANSGMQDTRSSPPAFLDLADSAAARFSSDISTRIEQKRVEHERQRAAQRRVFEEQMRALEQQQIAEERALLKHDSPNANGTGGGTVGQMQQQHFEAGGAGSEGGMHPHHLVMPSFNMNMGMALSAPTTPPLADHAQHPHQQLHHGGGSGMYDEQAIRAAMNGFAPTAANSTPGMMNNGLSTPTTNAANPFDNIASSTFSTVVGTPSSSAGGGGQNQSPAKRKSVNITPSPEIIQTAGSGATTGAYHLGHFSAGLTPTSTTNSSVSPGSAGMGLNGILGSFSGHGAGVGGQGGGAYGQGARSMPASRRASAGSKDGGGVGDDLVQGLRGLGIGSGGAGDSNTPTDDRHGGGGGGNGRMLNSIITSSGGMGGRPVPGPYTSASAFGHSAFLFDTELDDEMQNSLKHLPMTTEDDRFSGLRSSSNLGVGVSGALGNDYTRQLSVSSAALDLAPLSQTPPRSSFLASRAGLQHHHNGAGSSEWPQFNNSGPPRPSSGSGGPRVGSAASGAGGMGGLLPSGIGAGLGNNSHGGSTGMYRNGGAMTAGNATPVASGNGTNTPLTGSYPLKSAASVGDPARRMTPNGGGGLSSLSKHISISNNSSGNSNALGPLTGQSPESRGGGSPARFLASDASSSAGGSVGGGNGPSGFHLGVAGGARSVPATPLSVLPGSHAAASLLKTQPIGPLSPPNNSHYHSQQDNNTSYATPDMSGPYNTPGGGSTGHRGSAPQGMVNLSGTPAGMYEPVAYGSIAGGAGDASAGDDGYLQYTGGASGDAYDAGVGSGDYGVYQTGGLGMAALGAGANAFIPGGGYGNSNKSHGAGGNHLMGGSTDLQAVTNAASSAHASQNVNRPAHATVYNGRYGYGNNAGGPGAVPGGMGGGGRTASTGGGPGVGSNFGGGESKMGGLHGPKHKRSDIDREYNRFSGTRLEDLVGEISTLCKDQHGCRYLQKKLEENIPEYRDIIFRETFPHFAELMTDPFGNYLCQKLLEFSTDEQRSSICQSVAHDLVQISLNMHGTRAVQKMIDFLSNSRQTDQRYDAQIHSIIVALSMHVVTLIKDLNGNHVVQKCLNKLAAEDNQFIYNAVAQHCVEVATHRHGCCVLQRCIDHASETQKMQLVSEITYNALTLVQDPYGNYVVQYILDLNDNRFSDAVIRQFFGNVCALSVQKFSSNVIEKCIRVAEQSTRKMLIEEFLNRNRLEKLLRDSFGNYCVQTALDYAEPDQRRNLVEGIRPILPLIRNTPYGKRIQSKLQREQMEATHGTHYGYRPPAHAGFMNVALNNNGIPGHGHGVQPRHVSQPSLHHTGGMMEHYGNQSPMYSHAIPPGYANQSHLHTMGPGYGAHPMLHRQGSGGSVMGDATYATVPPYSTPLTTGYTLPMPDHYARPNYGYSM